MNMAVPLFISWWFLVVYKFILYNLHQADTPLTHSTIALTNIVWAIIQYMPSVLWRCWLGGTWLSMWSEVQMICIWSRWYHCHPIVSCSSKIQSALPFWFWLTQVVLEKRPLNGCNSSSSLSCNCDRSDNAPKGIYGLRWHKSLKFCGNSSPFQFMVIE